MDNDENPDYQQPLYRAYNGVVQEGQDPHGLYLERNSASAEAQLGLSDYSHAKPWNMLATSHGNTTKAQFVKLVMVKDKENKPLPTIVALHTKTNHKGKITTKCIALQPQNTKVITINNQDRKLKKVAIPEGESCE